MLESSRIGSFLNDIWEQSNRSTVQKLDESKDVSSTTDNNLTKKDIEAALVAHINQINEKHNSEIQTIKDDITQIRNQKNQASENLSDLKLKVDKFYDFKIHIVIGGIIVIITGAWTLYTYLNDKYEKLNERMTEVTLQNNKTQGSTNIQISELSENLKLLRGDVGKLDNLPSNMEVLSHRVDQVEKSYSKIEDKVNSKFTKDKS